MSVTRLSKKQIDDIYRRVEAGEPKRAISREYDISYNRLVRICNECSSKAAQSSLETIINTDTCVISEPSQIPLASAVLTSALQEVYRRLNTEQDRTLMETKDLTRVISCVANLLKTDDDDNKSKTSDILLNQLKNKTESTYIQYHEQAD